MLTVLLIVVVLLVLFDKPIVAGTVATGKYLYSKLPAIGSPAGLFAAKVELPIWKVVVLIGAFWFISSGGIKLPDWKLPYLPSFPSWITPKADSAIYVYEKDQGGVPPAVMSGLSKLNSDRKLVATEFEQDTKDGTGEVPEQYKVALEAAKKAGLPSLVACSGSRVLKVTKDPRTEEDVLKGVP